MGGQAAAGGEVAAWDGQHAYHDPDLLGPEHVHPQQR